MAILAPVSVLLFVLIAPVGAAQLMRQTAELAWGLLNGAAQSMQTFMTTLIK